MAPSAVLRPFSRLLAPARFPSCSSTRSKFYVREPVHAKPDWLKVGLTLGTSVFLWVYNSQIRKVTDKMVPPVQVSPLIKLGRYSALVLGMAYGAKRYSYLKPRAEEERRVAAEEKKRLDELNRIERERAEAQDDSILK